MSDQVGDSNVEAYEIMAEILVTVRKIVHRGLEKAAGKTWYLDGCPPGVYERLVARKENEVAIDRFDREYQELISFASLDDLAEIIEYNEELAHLLERIAPEGATIVERFRQIETLRLKLDAAVPLSEEDLDDLLLYHQEFRQSLAKPKEKSEPEDEPDPAPAAADEAEVIEVSEDKESVAAGDFGAEVTEAEELGAEDVITDEPSDEFGTAVVDSDVIEAPAVAGALGESALEAERAMASDDDEEVLRVLHREIMSVAEHVLKGDFDQEVPVWQTLKASGWYDIKQTTLAISPVEQFYSIAEEVCAKNLEGIARDEIKSFVSDSGVGKLLLSLGEMFKRQEL
jgi:hypothetical protein